MSKRTLAAVLAIAAGICLPGAGRAADQVILGKKLLVNNPTGSEANRKVIGVASERATDVPAPIVDPTSVGATLRVIANGTTNSDQSYVLDGGGWAPLGSVGYKYLGPTGGDGDPVKLVIVKRTPSGTALLKINVSGGLGTQSLDVVPPNAGTDGGYILSIGSERYCASFGGAAGGTEVKDTAMLWKVIRPTAQGGCPTPPTTTTTSSSTTTSTSSSTSTSSTTTTIPGPSPLCPGDTTRTLFVGGPGTGACHVYDDDPTNCEKAFHMSPCGPASCFYDSGSCNGCGANNREQGFCVNTCIEGAPSCPGDATRTIFAGYAGSSACTNLSFSPTLCNQAFHIGGDGIAASCFHDGSDCLGCGPNNLSSGLCQNTCPVCEGNPARDTFAGGPGSQGCSNLSTQSSCEGAFVIGDNRTSNSCAWDGGCFGCGPQNHNDGLCSNECPTCANDPSRTIFLGGPGNGACTQFDGSPILCEQAFHLGGGDCPGIFSCFYDFDNDACLGCGQPNQASGLCTNTCAAPICGDGTVNLPGEECDGGDVGTCAGNEICGFDCQCAPCGATVIPAGGGVFNGTTTGTGSLASSCGFGTLTAPEQTFLWTPSTSGTATIETCGGITNFDTVVSLRVGGCNGTEVACNDDACLVSSRIMPTVTAGTPYVIVVDGYGGSFGSFTLTVTPAP
jgi:hypothetical protein